MKITLQKAGAGLLAIGLVGAAVNFFQLYSIPGKCPAESTCGDGLFDHWVFQERILMAIAGLGLILIAYAVLRRKAHR